MDEGTFGEQARAVVALIERAQASDAAHLKQAVAEAERATVRLRDALIHTLRTNPSGTDAARHRAALKQVNVALSLLVGVENPLGAIPWQWLGQAREALRSAFP